MHIPDGYLSPLMSLGAGMVTVPAWAIAVRRVQAVLNNRTVPLLAIFSAFAFTIMMFNVPVPGGTTAHGVGGTLIAIVLGVPASILGVSMALILQALFFGDGGVLAIFANCLNMGIILPVVGYYSYRLIAGRSPILSTRRVWAAGIGAYVGITASALAVGIELGVQPLLFTDAAGHPMYSPYGLEAAIPAMLIAHIVGASIVEALITALGVAYLQKRHPEYLTSLSTVFAGSGDVAEGQASGVPLWKIVTGTLAVAIVALLGAGLVTGGGDFGHLFGADWSRVNWQDVGSMLVIVLVLAAVLVPLTWLVLPRKLKGIGAAFVAVAILAPLGLIAPGFAYGEGSPEEVRSAFGYVPSGLRDLSGVFSAPLSGYNLRLPFFEGSNAPLWHAAIGYEISGIIGIVLLGGLVWGLASLLGRRSATSPSDIKPAARPGGGRISWLEKTVAGIAASIEQAVFTEEHARKDGWLQRIDPRAKLIMFLASVLAASLLNSFLALAALYVVVLLAARTSKVPFDFFVKRVWLGIPFFAGIVIVPSIFFSGAPYLFDLPLGPIHLAPSIPGLMGAAVFVARVGVSVSLAVLLVLTTPWADVLKSLQALKVPQVFVLLLSMTYRYIFLFFRSANGMFEARKSRMVGQTSGSEHRGWISGSMTGLMSKSFKMSNDVYAAMLARGFTGQVRSYSQYRMSAVDWAALLVTVVISIAALAAGRYIG